MPDTFVASKTDSTYDFFPRGTVADHIELDKLINAIESRTDKTGTILIRDNGKEPLLSASASTVYGSATFREYFANIYWKSERPGGTRFINDDNCIFCPGKYINLHDGSTPHATAGVVFGTFTAVSTIGVAELTGVSMTGAALVKGDHVYITGDNALPVEPHIAGGSNRPAECRIVTAVSGGTVALNKPLTATYTTNPRIIRYRPWTGCFDGIIPSCTTDRTDGTQRPFIQACRTWNFRIYNSVAEKASGYWNFHQHQGLRVEGVHVLDVPRPVNDYGVLIGAGDDAVVQDCKFRQCRHGFSTGGWQVGNNIWGCLDCDVINCTSEMAGDGTNAFVAFDTHPLGGKVRFRNCRVKSTCKPSGKVSFAFSGRSADVELLDCSAEGSSDYNLTGVRPMAANWKVERFKGDKLWRGIQFGPGNHNEYWDNLTIINPRLTDILSNGILIWSQVGGAGVPNNVHVYGGTYVKVAGNPGTLNVEPDANNPPNNRTLKRSIMTFLGGQGHRVVNAPMPGVGGTSGNHVYSVDATNLLSSSIALRGCDLTNYGSGDLGITADASGSVSITAANTAFNYHD